MLVLSRRPTETIRIGDDIVITVVRLGTGVVRLGIEAPKNLNVARGELQGLLGEVLPKAGDA